MENIDKQIEELFKIVQDKRKEISNAERPNWMTNCSFSFERNAGATERINLQTVQDVNVLVEILGFLISKSNSYGVASARLEVTSEFKWQGYTLTAWETDIRTRMNKIQIANKKADLDKWEARLSSLISPEMKRLMELQALQKELIGNQ